MGIRKLNKFITDTGLTVEYKNLDCYSKQIRTQIKKTHNVMIGVDVWLFAHKYQHSYNDIIIGFWNQIVKFLSKKIIPVYVFDGEPPEEKQNIIQYRINKRNALKNKILHIEEQLNNESEWCKIKLLSEKKRLNKSVIYITKKNIATLKNFFDILHIPYVDAKGEADVVCTKLYKQGLIHAVYSDDMDLLAYGCDKLIKINKGMVIEYNLNYIVDKLELTNDGFRDMCILFGCDYLKSLPKMNYILSYILVKKYHSIENIIDNCINNNYMIIHDCYKFLITHNNNVTDEQLTILLDELNLSLTQFYDMCYIFECDFNRDHKIIENVTDNLFREQMIKYIEVNKDKYDKFISKYQRVRDIFNSSNIDTTDINFHNSIDDMIDTKKAVDFIVKNSQLNFEEYDIIRIINTLNYINNLIIDRLFYQSNTTSHNVNLNII